MARRDRSKGDADQRQSVALDAAPRVLRELLEDIQRSLYAQAKAFLEEHTLVATQRDEFLELCKNRAGMVDIAWCERAECEASVKTLTAATTRIVRPLDRTGLLCVACGEPARARAYFAQSY